MSTRARVTLRLFTTGAAGTLTVSVASRPRFSTGTGSSSSRVAESYMPAAVAPHTHASDDVVGLHTSGDEAEREEEELLSRASPAALETDNSFFRVYAVGGKIRRLKTDWRIIPRDEPWLAQVCVVAGQSWGV